MAQLFFCTNGRCFSEGEATVGLVQAKLGFARSGAAQVLPLSRFDRLEGELELGHISRFFRQLWSQRR